MYNSKADRIKACEEKFEVLFGKKPNEGEGNDPELFQILQRFIFGQVSYLGSLNDQTRELITCVVLAVYQTLPQLRSHAAAALHIGISPSQLREAVYNCMPMIGCPKTLNAIGAVDEILAESPEKMEAMIKISMSLLEQADYDTSQYRDFANANGQSLTT